jgi:hypothetical protein
VQIVDKLQLDKVNKHDKISFILLVLSGNQMDNQIKGLLASIYRTNTHGFGCRKKYRKEPLRFLDLKGYKESQMKSNSIISNKYIISLTLKRRKTFRAKLVDLSTFWAVPACPSLKNFEPY